MDLSSIFAEHRTRNRFFAFISFLYAFIIYSLSVAPTISFWDPAEYIAISHTLQIAHPPGSPFFAIVGRFVSMFMPAEYVALSINMISVTASAFTIMLLYLIVVRLIEEWRGSADQMDLMDQFGTYGGALFAAFTFTVTHTQWFNAVEAEMYASSMFLTALVVWMALRWSAQHDQPYSERWLLLIAYIFGIGIGVHLLNLLALFFVALIFYFKKYQFSPLSFLAMMGVSVAGFLAIYPVTIIHIPNIAGRIGSMTYGLIGPLTFIILIVAIVTFGIYYTQKKGMRVANMILLGYAMILIGYSSYALIMIRSDAEPPIDQNDPSEVAAFVNYLSRDQYGTSPLLKGNTYDNRTGNIDRTAEKLFPRRHSSQPHHMEYYANFDSDWSYFWQYQVNHMYLRYLNWNFIGREADIQDTGWYSGFSDTRHKNNPANTPYFYLPFLFGLFGLLYHFKNDWRRALSVTALFLLTGLAIIFYLNQTPAEPRERDYAYVGSFFAYAIWVGIGLTGIMELIKQFVGNNKAVSYGVLAVTFAAVPLWMLYQNWESHDRSDMYVPRDYAYNLLNSVERNAILFTNGDNDTFPLWYLQEVEGIRTDVRVVNLSLLNTDWYIKQLRDRTTHESLPLPISLSDEEIQQMTGQLELHNPGDIVIPVDKELLSSVFDADENMIEQNPEAVVQTASTNIAATELLFNQVRMATPFSEPVAVLDDEVRFYLEGRPAGRDNQGNMRYYLQTQDRMILEILQQNQWLRPVYFANTVSRSGLLNMEPYFQFEGKAFRVVPIRRNVGPFGHVDPDVHASRLESFQFNNWNSPTVYFDQNVRRMLGNYRYGFTQLADAYMERGEREQAAYWLKYGEDMIPFREIENDWTIAALYAFRYMRVEENERANNLSDFIREQLMHELRYDMRALDRAEIRMQNLDEEIRRARAQANTGKAQSLNRERQRLSRQRDNVIDDVSFTVSRLTIIQNIFYETGEIEKAETLTIEVNGMTEGRLPLPESIEESREQIERFGLGV
ncbi:glycosyltransferase family 117 protein [Rhodohalobacter halophilus]|uniref:glycosyltransferase family 117 protein n=1 Tax=Rhodohalobacter halophilus TaxID=1812810 RepID=UPI000A52D74A|nr:DUF2723 domain-containing protein [Rhodohalobacter halophilus]